MTENAQPPSNNPSPEAARFHAFLSHNGKDKLAVETLATKLENCGVSCWLDKWNLIPGDPWQPALERALALCNTCVVFFGPHGVGPWHDEEMRLALQRRVSSHGGSLRVLPVILPGGQRARESDLPPFLQGTTWVEFFQSLDEDDALHRLECGIRGIPPGRRPGDVVPGGECPYLGLRTFQPSDAALFFGRDAKVQELVDRLRMNFGTPRENRFLVLFGSSGSGKSSLALAGLIPALMRGELKDSNYWPVVRLRPDFNPWESLQIALASNEKLARHVAAVPSIITRPEDEQRRLHLTARLALYDQPESHRLFVLIDQFEEVFTLCKDERIRQQFFDNILYATNVAGGRTIVVLTMRADFYHRCAAHEGLRAAVSEYQSLIGPFAEKELREVIERPAQLVGAELEPGLMELLLSDMTGRIGALPFLEHALERLWERRDGRILLAKAYTKMGRLEGALDAHAESFFKNDLSVEEQELCRQIMVDLVRPGEGSADTKKRVFINELAPSDAKRRVLTKLADSRLVTTDGRLHGSAGQAELAHEALINGWRRLGEWVNENRERSRYKEKLIQSASDWEKGPWQDDFLYRGAQLSTVEEMFGADRDALPPLAQDFLAASVAYRDREFGETVSALKRQERWKKRFLFAAILVGLLLASVLGLGRFCYQKASDAVSAEGDAISSRLNAQLLEKITRAKLGSAYRIIAERTDDPILAAQIFLKGANEFASAREPALAANAALEATLRINSTSIDATFPHNGRLRGVRHPKSYPRFLTWSTDGAARLWRVERLGLESFMSDRYWMEHEWTDNAPLFRGHRGVFVASMIQDFEHKAPIIGAAYTNKTGQILTWSEDGMARLWEIGARDAEPIQTFDHGGPVVGAFFNKDDNRLLTWSKDGAARIWKVGKGETESIQTFRHDGPITGAVYTNDESRVLTWSEDGAVRLWKVGAGMNAPIQSLEHKGPVVGAAFNTRDDRLLTWSTNGTAMIWEVGTGKRESVQCFRHKGPITGAIFTHDDSRILTWSEDGTARLWELGEGKNEPIQSFAHEGPVVGAAFNNDESRVLTSSKDGSARIWEVGTGKKESIQCFQHKGELGGAIFNKDQKWVLTWSNDGTARRWMIGVSGGGPIQIFNQGQSIDGAIIDDDEGQILIWSRDGMARLFEIGSVNNLPIPSFEHAEPVSGAAFTKNGRGALTWSSDGTAWFWAIDTRGKRLVKILNQKDPIRGAAFDWEAERVLTWSSDGTAQLSNLGNDRYAISRIDNKGPIVGAVFEKKSYRIVIWSSDGRARLWSLGTENYKGPIREFVHKGPIIGAVYTDDENRLLTWSKDGTARLWAVHANGEKPLQVFNHGGMLTGAVITKDQRWVLTWGEDGAALLWAVGVESKVPIQRFDHAKPMIGALFTKDEKRLLTWSQDGVARLWEVRTRKNEPLLSFEQKDIAHAAFTEDENLILAWSRNGTLQVWSAIAKGDAALLRIEQSKPAKGLVSSDSGNQVLMWYEDGTARRLAIPEQPARSLTEKILELETSTGTAFLKSGELRNLRFDEWAEREQELDILRRKRLVR